MSTRKLILFLFVAVAALFSLIHFLPGVSNPHSVVTLSDTQKVLVEEHIRTNISTLSPEPAVLGGTFYVTNVTFAEESPANPEEGQYVGRVEYEDGHIALIAQFTFLFDSNGRPVIVSFDILTDEHQDFVLEDYTSVAHGLSFEYPSYYFLEEKNTGTAQGGRTTIILTEDTEENRLVREGKSPGREGPVAITIDVYQNSSEDLSAEAWVRGSNDSNFKLSNGLLSVTDVGGERGVAYAWSGLYEADNVAVSSNGKVYSFVVTYIAPNDQIRNDFQKLLKTVSFVPIDEVPQIQ